MFNETLSGANISLSLTGPGKLAAILFSCVAFSSSEAGTSGIGTNVPMPLFLNSNNLDNS